MNASALAPSFVKRAVWNYKHRQRKIHALGCPEDFVDFLMARLTPFDTVLDLGCGQGNLRAALRLRGWNGNYVGVDVSPTALLTARQCRDDHAEWVQSAIEEFPERPGIVCFCESLYYAANIPQLLRRWAEHPVCVRIVQEDKHQDAIAHLRGFQRIGIIWYSCATF